MKMRLPIATALIIGGVLLPLPARAGASAFVFKNASRNVTIDPDGIWTGDALSGGKVSIFTYELRGAGDYLVVSQVWNDDCGIGTCPTRLVRVVPDGRRTVLVDDMMHQVIPPNDPRFAELPKTGPQAAYARHPFRLSDDGKTLLNGDFTFDLAGAKP